ncbi:hypothetical protein [Pimelobacter simplex]|uniref:hypothetical protein n=1 Tax=Nocardioides simplex TaxID=2045 RepID=UPI001933B065|nr:hypothetical protein [Pimelobacter simplex]
MTLPPFDITSLPGEWWEVEAAEAAEQLEQELMREVPKGHLLHGVTVRAVAVRHHLKDVVFWLPAVHQWGLVHLTGQVEKDPMWPYTICTPEWDELVDQLAGD